MSVVALIIKLIKRKKKMNEELEIGTFTPNTHPVLAKLKEELLEAQTKYADTYSRLTTVFDEKSKLSDKYCKAEYALTDLLKEMIADEDITLENAQRIADIFDNVILTKRISIRYDIVATVEVEVPFGADEDEVADNTYCDSVRFDTYESNHEVLEVDFDVTDWNVVS
jgi:hypothetical protein